MFRSILIAIIFPLMISSCSHKKKTDENRAMLHLKIGTSHLAKGNYPQALSELQQSLALDPNNSMTLNNIGLAYYVRAKFPKAENYVRRALSIKPSYTEARNNLGRILIEQGLYGEAISQLQKCIDDLTYPFPAKSWSNLGIAQFKSKNFNKAKLAFRRAVELNNRTCQTLELYGRTYFELKDYTQSTKILNWALRICGPKKQAAPHYYSALAYFQLGQSEESLARLREIISHYPNSHYANKATKMLAILTR